MAGWRRDADPKSKTLQHPSSCSCLPDSCLSLTPFLCMSPCDGRETKHYYSGMMFFKLDICCLFIWEFGKGFGSSWWSDLEEIIRWSWQQASQAHHSDAEEGAPNGIQTSTLLWMLWPWVPKEGLCSFRSKILSTREWNTWYHTEKSRSWDPKRGGTETKIHTKLTKTKKGCMCSQVNPPLSRKNGALCLISFPQLNPHNTIHWTEEETEAWEHEITCLRSYSYLVKEWELEPWLSWPESFLKTLRLSCYQKEPSLGLLSARSGVGAAWEIKWHQSWRPCHWLMSSPLCCLTCPLPYIALWCQPNPS